MVFSAFRWQLVSRWSVDKYFGEHDREGEANGQEGNGAKVQALFRGTEEVRAARGKRARIWALFGRLQLWMWIDVLRGRSDTDKQKTMG